MGAMKEQEIILYNEENHKEIVDQEIHYTKGAQFVDLTPTKDGYATMAAMFGDNILSVVERDQRENARALIGSIINIAGHLGNAMAAGDEDAKKAYDSLVAHFPQGK
jgi:hypothetical protein